MIKSIHYFILFISILLASCSGSDEVDSSDRIQMAGSTGRIGELVVVIPDAQWKGVLGEAILDVFENNYPVLPQYEPRLNVIQQSWDLYTKYYYRHRNVLIVNVEEVIDNRETRTILHTKVNGRGQLIFEIIARTPEEFLEELSKKGAGIIDKIEETEIEREYKNISKNRNRQAESILAKDHGIELTIPSIFSISENENDFIWLRGPSYNGKKAATQEGILIYYTDYVNDSLLEAETILRRRDSILKEKVPGPQIGSYMSTQYHPDYAPIERVIDLSDRYTLEIKGIWRIKEGTNMAGPFVSLSTVDESTNRMVTIEGYVYAPGEKKKPLIRRMETIIKTIQFSGMKKELTDQDTIKSSN